MQPEEFTNDDLMELEAPRKDEERPEEEVTEELKRCLMQETEKGFSYLQRHCSFLRHRTQNAELYTSAAAAVQNAIQCYRVICDKKKGLLPKHHWIIFSRG